MTRVHHVKIPVTDLARSVVWYARLEALAALAARCDRLSIEHSAIRDRGQDEAVVDVPDPDGTVLRFLWERQDEQTSRFTGLSFGAGGPPAFYHTPRLPVTHSPQTR